MGHFLLLLLTIYFWFCKYLLWILYLSSIIFVFYSKNFTIHLSFLVFSFNILWFFYSLILTSQSVSFFFFLICFFCPYLHYLFIHFVSNLYIRCLFLANLLLYISCQPTDTHLLTSVLKVGLSIVCISVSKPPPKYHPCLFCQALP